jgi:hypothetical protein
MLNRGFSIRLLIVARTGLLLAAIGAGSVLAASEPPKEAPKEGEIRYGRIVYVHDGTCPQGEIKEIRGGSREKNIPRQVRCVKHPGQSQ